MNQQEKILYHQIHPVKLLADWIPGLGSAWLMWQHDLVATLLVTLIPAILASALIIKTANLELYKNSAAGRYIKLYMSPLMQGVRLAGQVVYWIGAWYHLPAVMVASVLLILFGWFNGFIFPRKHSI